MAQSFSAIRGSFLAPLRVVLLASCLVASGVVAHAATARVASPSAGVAAGIGDDGVHTNCIDPAFPPKEYYEDQNADQPIGFDIDLTIALAERLGVEAEFVPMEFTGLPPGQFFSVPRQERTRQFLRIDE